MKAPIKKLVIETDIDIKPVLHDLQATTCAAAIEIKKGKKDAPAKTKIED